MKNFKISYGRGDLDVELMKEKFVFNEECIEEGMYEVKVVIEGKEYNGFVGDEVVFINGVDDKFEEGDIYWLEEKGEIEYIDEEDV